jgi:uncharacterized protein YacL
MTKLFLVSILICCGTLLACIYGIIHDQITYRISEEFYTHIRFAQSEIAPTESWWGVTKVAVINTWKIGFIISLILSCTGLIHRNEKRLLKHTIQSFLITSSIAAILTVIGFIMGKFHNPELEKLPNTILDKSNFLLVQSIHNFTYIGGLIGMFVGVYWQFYKHKKHNKESPNY